MSASDPALQDSLLALRRAIGSGTLPTPTTSPELSLQHATEDLAQATHLYFAQPISQAIPLSTPTRFISAATQSAVDLRSIFFAWQKKDVAIQEYITSAEELNEALKDKEQGEKVQNLVFVERLDLLTWLEGASDESEYIKPLEGAAAAAEAAAAAAGAAQAEASAGIASGATGGISSVPSGAAGAAPAGAQGTRAQKPIDPRLQEIYNGERKTGDRNTALRGIKPTVSGPGRQKTATCRKHSPDIRITRTSPTSAKAPSYSWIATAPAQVKQVPNLAARLQWSPPHQQDFQCPPHENRAPVPTQSSSSPPPPPPSSACRTSSPFYKTVFSCHPTIQHSACPPKPTSWN